MSDNIKIWLGDLGAYNSGRLVGEWLSLPMDADELAAAVNKYSRNGEGDYFIADWETPEGIPQRAVKEYSDPAQLNELAERLDGLNDHDRARVGYLIDDGCNISDALDGYEDVTFYEGMTLEQVAEQFVDDGLFGMIPDNIQPYIDYEKLGRDLGFDGYHETPAGVFHRG